MGRTEDKKEEDETAAPAWGHVRKGGENRADLTEKKYPTLRSTGTNINIDDGSNAKVNIETTKNVFSALGNDDSDDENKRPTQIKPAMVQKKKGEMQKVANKREVDKVNKAAKKSAKKEADEEAESSEEEEEEEEDEEEKAAEMEKRKAAEAK